MTWDKKVLSAWSVACKARERAHAPYSKFRVGAAVKFKGHDEAFEGCNIENASFGATLCAERSALAHATSRHGKSEVEFVVVVTEGEPAPPCGLCLQALVEFAGNDTPIYLATDAGIQKRYFLNELIPQAFRNFKPNAD